MNITSAKYQKSFEGTNKIILAIIDGDEWYIPLDPENSDYKEIMRQVEAGELTIQPADTEGE